MNRFLLAFVLAFLHLSGFSQDLSNKGKEFWVGYGSHVAMYNQNGGALLADGGAQNMVLYFTSDRNAKILVEIPASGWKDSISLTANTVVTSSPIPKTGSSDARIGSEGINKNGIHITADVPIIAYAHIYYQSVSGATLLFPVATLSREYYSINFDQISNQNYSYCYSYVIATEDSTNIEIIPSVNTIKNKIGDTIRVKLNKGEIYNVFGRLTSATRGEDLTGTQIRSIATLTSPCKKIAVFSGSGKIAITCTNSTASSDNYMQQCFPANAWGKKYLTVPTNKLPNNYFRIAIKNKNTTVKVNGVKQTFLINNFYYQIQILEPSIIESDEPIMVSQYISSATMGRNQQNNTLFVQSSCNPNLIDDNGDPEMIYLSPIEQTIKKVTINSTQNAGITLHYLNLVIHKNGVNSLTVDGASPTSSFSSHPGDNDYVYFQIPLQSGSHTIQSDSGFNAIAYGYGVFESYGYNAGTNLINLNQFVSIKNKYATVNFPSTCKDAPFNLSITLPFKPLSLGWKFYGNLDLGADPDILKGEPGLPIVPDDSILSTTNSKSFLYIYKLKNLDNTDREFKISKKGIVPVDVIANNPTADGCSGEQTIPYDITVYDPPTNTINSSNIGCLEDTILFTANTQTEDVPVLKYLWTVNDLSYDTTSRNISIKYNTEGLKKVSLSVITNIGCLSKNFDTTILLSSKPTPQFEPAGSLCIGKEQTLIDKSIPRGNSTIEEWIWNYSDKQKPDTFTVLNPSKSPQKIFNDSIIVVKLDLKTNSGCKNSLTDTLFIRPNPNVQMILPEICLEDSIAIFKSASTVSGIENKIDLFEWNFGDPVSSIESNKGTGESSKHRYTNPGNYKISLSTTTNFGCNSTADSSFTINGSTPRAEFKVISESGLCSNKPITIKNTSVVDVGSVGKIELFWDFDGVSNRPDSTDENPKVNGLYAKQFDNFQFASRTIRIYMTAYTGGVCKDSYDSTIVLNGSPLDSLRDLSPICTRKEKRLLDAAVIQKVSGVNGVEVYSGKGVVSEGGKFYFDPKIDSGYYTIYHKYTTEKGCFAEDSSLIRVNFTPVIDAGPDMTVLDDTTRQILAKATGVDMKYTWTPKLYLSSDTILQPLVIKPVTDITYKLSVTGFGNCTEIDQFRMTALNMIEPTNTFTPNGDGINDTWSIKYIEKYPESIVEVFNIQGTKVYKSPTKYLPWDGKTKEGDVLPAGTYYYFIDPKNFRKKRTGFVTILK